MDGEVRIAELPGHPSHLATLFQPELAPEHEGPHPFVRAFARAPAGTAAARTTAPAQIPGPAQIPDPAPARPSR
ncbi:hypothetical protein [Kitasatospora sp. NPDC090308]|uniref:hypothetical protein n=1 Tax=Kitasatospora sp. NPDC090308 TaxID=3364082 RepID=UPI00382C49CC